MPKQLVYNQDSIIVVSENNGDIIHTHAFAALLEETKLDVMVCRRSDPESKGKIEAVVRFIKGNFIENRLFMDLDIWNRSFEEWLIRTGNGRIHGTTKRLRYVSGRASTFAAVAWRSARAACQRYGTDCAQGQHNPLPFKSLRSAFGHIQQAKEGGYRIRRSAKTEYSHHLPLFLTGLFLNARYSILQVMAIA